jgi:hypothetical protein
MTNISMVEIGSFLTNKDKRIKHECANCLPYKRITKIDFAGNIHLRNNVNSKTDMIEVEKGDLKAIGLEGEFGDNITLKWCTSKELEKLNPLEMTPLEALTYLFELQKKVKEGK